MAFDDINQAESIRRIALRFYRDDAFITDSATPGWDRSEHVFSNDRTWIRNRQERRALWVSLYGLAKWMVENPNINAAYLKALDDKIWALGHSAKNEASRLAWKMEKSGLLGARS